MIKRLISAFVICTAASVASSADERAGSAGEPASAADPADRKDHSAEAKEYKDDVEVVAADAAGKQLTVRMDGEEKSLDVIGAPAVKALKVVKRGDKIRLFFEDRDLDGKPDAVKAFTITKPSAQADRELRDRAAGEGEETAADEEPATGKEPASYRDEEREKSPVRE